MKNFYRNYLRVILRWEQQYTGTGYIQGIGFDINVKRFKIGNWFSIITDFKINADREWLDKLKNKLK